MRLRSAHALAATLAIALSLSACDDWFGDTNKTTLPGKRISVLTQDSDLKPDGSAEAANILLPPPEGNDDWPQAGGYANHAMHHMKVPDHLKPAWLTNVGTGADSRLKLLAQPVVAEGRVFTLDAKNEVTAVDAKTGETVWDADISPEDSGNGSGGGLAYEDGHIFVGTGFGEVVALDAHSGKVLWRQKTTGPIRGAPTVHDQRVYAITVDNQLHCLAADDGRVLWTHQGTPEQALLMAGTSPAVDGDVVVVPYSSGELYALRAENGTELWQDSLSTISRTQGVAQLTDVDARPIIDRGRVYAIGHADMMVAIDLRTGRRLWERQIGSIQSPWVAGDYLYLVTNNNQAVALEAKTGKVLWVTQLDTWDDPEGKKDRIVWTGPVLASDRLIIGGSNGFLITLSPYTGQVLGKIEAPSGISIQPVIAQDTVFFFTDDADLAAFR